MKHSLLNKKDCEEFSPLTKFGGSNPTHLINNRMPPSKSKQSTKSYSALFLTQKGDVEIGTIQGDVSGVTLASIQNHYKKRQVIEPIGTYSYKSYTLFLFGTTAGKEGQENQHQLPPPYDITNFYMDIILLASKDEDSFSSPLPFQMDEYENFYTKSFGGYTSDNSDEEDEVDVEFDAVDEVPIEEGKEFVPEEEDDDEEEEEDEEAEEGDNIVEAEAEEADQIVPKIKAVKKKKLTSKAASNSILAGTATAYPDKPILSEEEQLQEESIPETETELTVAQRVRVFSALTKLFSATLTPLNILQLESSIYNGSIKRARQQSIVRSWTYPLFSHIYMMHAKHISANFHPDSYVGNKELFERFKTKEITFTDIAKMDIYELLPSRWKEQFEKQQVREKRQLEGNRSMATDIFLCTKCWKRECTYYEMQTRSADEPMTIFITCLNCGKHWRQ
jgi:DNA-directed RNA polymerase subunit M/transcription elongation factor TFIIS